MDRILIKDLLARCILGITAEERREKQDVLISVALSLDLAPAGRSDRVEDGVNYRPIKKRILAGSETASPPDQRAARQSSLIEGGVGATDRDR